MLKERKDDIAPEGTAVEPAPDTGGQVFPHRFKPNNPPTVCLTVDEPLNVLDRVGGGGSALDQRAVVEVTVGWIGAVYEEIYAENREGGELLGVGAIFGLAFRVRVLGYQFGLDPE